MNPIAYTEKVVRSFLRYQLTAYPFADERLGIITIHDMPKLLRQLSPKRRSVAVGVAWRRRGSLGMNIGDELMHAYAATTFTAQTAKGEIRIRVGEPTR